MEKGSKQRFLVRAWPGENLPGGGLFYVPNPKSGYQVIIGHTKVLSMNKSEEARIRYAIELENIEEHLKIVHAHGFVNIDCGCGYDMPIKVLACLRLEELQEFYILL